MGVPIGVPRQGLQENGSYIDSHAADTVMINSILTEVISQKPEDPLVAVHAALGKALEGRGDGTGLPPQIFIPYGGKVCVEYVWLGGAPDQYFSGIDMRSKTKTMNKVPKEANEY